jgi:hypothetical protein
MRILHICSHKRSIPSSAIFRPAIYGALRSRSVSDCESDRTTYAIENIGLIILKRPLRQVAEVFLALRTPLHVQTTGQGAWRGLPLQAPCTTALMLQIIYVRTF